MRTISPFQSWTLTGATGNFTLGVGGEVSRVYGVYLVYGAGAPGTTTFSFSNMGRTFFTSAAGNTPIYYPILEQAFGNTGTVLTTGNPYIEAVVNGTVTIQIANAAAGAGYSASIFLIDGTG